MSLALKEVCKPLVRSQYRPPVHTKIPALGGDFLFQTPQQENASRWNAEDMLALNRHTRHSRMDVIRIPDQGLTQPLCATLRPRLVKCKQTGLRSRNALGGAGMVVAKPQHFRDMCRASSPEIYQIERFAARCTRSMHGDLFRSYAIRILNMARSFPSCQIGSALWRITLGRPCEQALHALSLSLAAYPFTQAVVALARPAILCLRGVRVSAWPCGQSAGSGSR